MSYISKTVTVIAGLYYPDGSRQTSANIAWQKRWATILQLGLMAGLWIIII